jgi:formate C-acetyltransferase
MLNSTIIHEGSWSGFSSGDWCENVNVVDFIRKNITPYGGDGAFLTPATTKTTKLWEMVSELIKAQARLNCSP